jgi:hypothetical protein
LEIEGLLKVADSRENFMKSIILTLIMSLVLLSNVWADGVEVDLIEGGTVIPVQNDNIRMVSEEVRMFGDIKVIANFVFENLSNKPATIKMGFPIPSGEWAVPIDGHPYTYFIYITKTGALWSGTIGKADFYLELTERLMRLLTDKRYNFKLSIKPNGYVIRDSVTEEFVVKNGQIEWHFANWKPTENIGVALIENEEADKLFSQILRTSENFKIVKNEKALAEHKVTEKVSQYFKDKKYDAGQRYYNQADIEKWLEFQPVDTDNDVIQIFQRLFVKALRNEIYARHGRIFTTPEMKQILNVYHGTNQGRISKKPT